MYAHGRPAGAIVCQKQYDQLGIYDTLLGLHHRFLPKMTCYAWIEYRTLISGLAISIREWDHKVRTCHDANRANTPSAPHDSVTYFRLPLLQYLALDHPNSHTLHQASFVGLGGWGAWVLACELSHQYVLMHLV